MNRTVVLAIAAVLAVWNLIALFTVIRDKRTAQRNGKLDPAHRSRRVPEKRFLLFAATLAGAGVLVGFYGMRHKTKHIKLLCGTWIFAVLSYAAAAAALYFFVLR